MFASCYIQGDKVTAHDCPAGWAHDGNQCSFVPSSWNRRENGNEAKILTVKSCAASYSCPSPEAVCGKPRILTRDGRESFRDASAKRRCPA